MIALDEPAQTRAEFERAFAAERGSTPRLMGERGWHSHPAAPDGDGGHAPWQAVHLPDESSEAEIAILKLSAAGVLRGEIQRFGGGG